MSSPSLPSSVETEQALLGSILLDPSNILVVQSICSAQDFYIERHAWIYEVLLALENRRDAIDYITVTNELERSGKLNEIGGAAYVVALINSVATPSLAEQYAKEVHDFAIRRHLISAASKILQYGYDYRGEEAHTKAWDTLAEIAPRNGSREISINEAVGEQILNYRLHWDKPQEVIGLPTGYYDLDKILGGLRTGVYVAAGVTSIGKTSFALGTALHIARDNKRVAIFSLEMSRGQLIDRLIAYEAKISSRRIESGYLNDVEKRAIETAAYKVSNLPITILELAEPTSAVICSKAIELTREGLDFAIVDYIQLITDEGDTEAKALDDAMRKIFHTAHRIQCPFLVLSQLRRGIEQRNTHIPFLADLRASGGIEQGADCVIFLSSEDYFHRFEDRYQKTNLVGGYIAKNRLGSGAGASFKMAFIEETGALENLVRGEK